MYNKFELIILSPKLQHPTWNSKFNCMEKHLLSIFLLYELDLVMLDSIT
jgi:hypothetical protein